MLNNIRVASALSDRKVANNTSESDSKAHHQGALNLKTSPLTPPLKPACNGLPDLNCLRVSWVCYEYLNVMAASEI